MEKRCLGVNHYLLNIRLKLLIILLLNITKWTPTSTFRTTTPRSQKWEVRSYRNTKITQQLHRKLLKSPFVRISIHMFQLQKHKKIILGLLGRHLEKLMTKEGRSTIEWENWMILTIRLRVCWLTKDRPRKILISILKNHPQYKNMIKTLKIG